MRFPKGFPKPRHYFMMKRKGMLSWFSPLPAKKRAPSLSPSENKPTKLPWWVWIFLFIVLSTLLKVCGYG